jgi:predicted dehydrogenase
MTIRAGLIGAGIMGRRMMEAMTAHPEISPAAVWDLNPEASRQAASQYSGLVISTSVEALCASSEVDLVYIATPPATHSGYVRMAVAAEKPVLCEKPLGVDLVDSRRLVEEVEAAGVPAAVNFPFAAAQPVTTLARVIRAQETGVPRLLEIRLHFSSWPRAWQAGAARWLSGPAEGGFLREVFSHFAYLTMRLVGPLTIHWARTVFSENPEEAETYVVAEMEAGGIPVRLFGGVGGAAPDANEWTLYGSEKSFRMQDWGDLFYATRDAWKPLPPDQKPAGQMREQLDQLVQLAQGAPNILPSLRMGLEVQEIVESLVVRPS